MEDAGVRYVVRLFGVRFKVRRRVTAEQAAKQKAYLEDKEGRRLPLVVSKGGQVVWEGVRYRVVASRREHRVDSVSEVNVVGVWERGHREPLWVMGNLPPGELLGVYRQRMKIEEAFRDLKGYLRMEGVMSKTLGHATAYLENAEKTLRLLAFAYALGLMVGVASRREQVVAMRREWRQKGGLVGGDGGTTH